MESGVGYQLLGQRMDGFIYRSSKDCTCCNVSCNLRFCLIPVCVYCTCGCMSVSLLNTILLEPSCCVLLWDAQLV